MGYIEIMIVTEICGDSLADLSKAITAGAERFELNLALSLGGITPSLGLLREALRMIKAAGRPEPVKIMAMVRPHGGGFCYDDFDFAVMLEDTRILVENGAAGIVFGILNADGTIDKERCRTMMRTIGTAEGVFHRAIDLCPDWKAALDMLCDLGVRRVLTSGHAPNVEAGLQTLKEMVAYANGRIEILPGGGVRRHNVLRLIAETGCTQVHFSLRKAGSETGLSQAELQDLMAAIQGRC
ncbi:MAG: copper homeostasis protein CutC [Spirochaetaceae bacterium]|nr:copper homeostasis protein CutC [Spirochaetaceae bacterium]